MAELFNEKGDLVTAYTEEEVQEKIESEASKLIEETNAQRQVEIDEMTMKLEETEKAKAELEEKMSKIDDKSLNFSNLRKKSEEKDSTIAELKGTIQKLEESMNQKFNQITSEGNKKKISTLISQIAGKDAELAKKIEFNYNRFNASPKDDEEVKKLINDAVLLSTGGAKKNLFSTDVMSSSGGTPIKSDLETDKLSDSGKEGAKILGISEQRLKKHKLI